MHTDITVKEYDIHELAEYINWIYFFHAWGFQPKYSSIADLPCMGISTQILVDSRHTWLRRLSCYVACILQGRGKTESIRGNATA